MTEQNGNESEIREYSIRENVFIGALVSEKIHEKLEGFSREEIMAAVIEIAEQFENEYPDRTSEQFERYCQKRLQQLKNL